MLTTILGSPVKRKLLLPLILQSTFDGTKANCSGSKRRRNVQKPMSKRMAWASEKAFAWCQESRKALLTCCFRAPKKMSVFPNSLKPDIEMLGCRIIDDFRNQAASRRFQIVRRRNNHSLDIVRFYQHLSCWRFRSAALRWNQHGPVALLLAPCPIIPSTLSTRTIDWLAPSLRALTPRGHFNKRDSKHGDNSRSDVPGCGP
jgi:hypothetical protein